MDKKKIFLVIGFIVLVLGLGLALYWVFFKPTIPITPTDNFNAGNLPGIGNGNIPIVNENINAPDQGLPWQQYIKDKVSDVASGGLTKVSEVSENEVRGLTSSPGGLQYYDDNEQKFYRITDSGTVEELSSQLFYQVEDVTWAGSGDKAILEYPDGSNILYNFKNGQQVTLPKELEDFSFDASDSQIAAKWMGSSEEDNWVVASNDDGSGMYLIQPLGDQAHNTFVSFSPDNQVAVMHRKYVDAQRQEVYPIGLHGETFKAFTVAGAGFEYDWSPEGNSLVYSVYNETSNYNPNLWVTNGSSSELGDIKVSLNISTWPDKCAFVGEDIMYCAVPQGLPRGAGLYPEIADRYPDNFYYINLNSGSKNLIASPVGESGSYTAHNLFVSNDQSTLYFTDQNGNLQSIKLK
ncbi:MAG: hypothetical protein A2406_04470 [Candidatus Komeilibacteria bacterium RIFOXYC1_FULL_37_11]|uniref:Dipeptidylpeptidase IV N-terminal domain-containing protein n=1 Tax=Candidatus Komeilibacteria bacterium RIFOXYC1_FULL_37_11 TaxID=1798555 RepID=A0A1G2BWT0_9BACT|nr:MAG: hypothetical protein A2406_04470 [Candidatus Komeilibacteria bacterium RIFOXYC1_FULL_37_11]OGY95745.1 MAG: hypothetical protein A2611_03115 [Candidatus Komeilibacteria bacterium RIFOXYD1_FULL_37_29]